MQAGFALVETGFCRAKHAAHVVSTNFAIFGLGFVGFYLVGYGLMFGGYSVPLIGFDEAPGEAFIGSGEWIFLWKGGFALTDMVGPGGAGAAALGFFLYMVAFMDTVATIPTGAMAERWKWNSFVGVGPLLRRHLLPAVRRLDLGRRLAVAGRQLDGPRLRLRRLRRLRRRAHRRWRGGARRCHRARPPHRQVQQGRLGQHAPGPPHPDGDARLLHPAVRLVRLQRRLHLRGDRRPVRHRWRPTPPSPAAFGAVAAMFIMQAKTGKPDPGMMVNGMLAGLVAITAPCAFVDPWAAAVIGVLAAGIVIFAVGFIERRGIDDPVGAIAVHGVGGTFGVLCVGIFANGTYGAGWNVTTEGDMAESGKGVIGILGGDFTLGLGQLGAQALGVVTLWTVIFGIAFTFFKIQNAVTKGGIRPTAEMEIDGMDIPEMGALAYPEFEFAIEQSDPEIGERRSSARPAGSVPEGEPVTSSTTDPSDAR